MEVDFILPVQVLGEEVRGEEDLEAFDLEASPRVEAEVVPVHGCEAEAVVAAQGAPINQ